MTTTRTASRLAVASLTLLALFSASQLPAIERSTRNLDAAMKHAEQCVAGNDLEGALAAYSEIIQDNPHNWKAFAGRAVVYAHLQLTTLAEEDNDRAVAAAPEAYEPLLNRAIDRFFKKRYADAIHDLDAAVHLSPEHTDLYHWRGCAHAELNQCDKAIADFTQVIERDTDQSSYHGVEYFNRGIAESNLGHFEDALKDYDQAEKAGQATVNQRAECLLELKRWREAEEIYTDVLQNTEETGAENENKRYEALRERSVTLAGQKLFERSEADLAEAFAMKPDNFLAYGTASWTRLFSGKTADARAAALKALGMQGDQLWIHLNLAHAYLLQGHFDWAKSIYLQDKDKRGSWGRNGAQIALQDLADLREAGIEHPDMAKAEAFLKQLPAAPAPSPAPSPSGDTAE